jgi:hypothetical protein
VGHSLSIFYALPGPLPAGGYTVEVDGYSSADDAHITAELLLRPGGAVDGGSDVQIAMMDGPPPPANGGSKARTWIKTAVCASGMGSAGDGLVLRVHYVSGSAIFGSISTVLTIP